MCFDRQDCYSYQDLNNTVAKVNSILDEFNVSMVIVGGDITSSAQPTQFVQARRLLDKLAVPVLDLRGSDDFPAVHRLAPRRAAAMAAAGNANSAQVVVEGPDHYFNEADESLHDAVLDWLDALP